MTAISDQLRYEALSQLVCGQGALAEKTLRAVRALLDDPSDRPWVISVLLTRLWLRECDGLDAGTIEGLAHAMGSSFIDVDQVMDLLEAQPHENWRDINTVWTHVLRGAGPHEMGDQRDRVDDDEIIEIAYLCHRIMVDPWDDSPDTQIRRLEERFPWLAALRHHVELERTLTNAFEEPTAAAPEEYATSVVSLDPCMLRAASLKMAAADNHTRQHLAAVSYVDVTRHAPAAGLDRIDRLTLQLVDSHVLVCCSGAAEALRAFSFDPKLHCVDPPSCEFVLEQLADTSLRAFIAPCFEDGIVLHNSRVSLAALVNRSVHLTFDEDQKLVPIGRFRPADVAGDPLSELVERLHHTGDGDAFVQALPEELSPASQRWRANDYLRRLMSWHRGFIRAPRRFARAVLSKGWIDDDVRGLAKRL